MWLKHPLSDHVTHSFVIIIIMFIEVLGCGINHNKFNVRSGYTNQMTENNE